MKKSMLLAIQSGIVVFLQVINNGGAQFIGATAVFILNVIFQPVAAIITSSLMHSLRREENEEERVGQVIRNGPAVGVAPVGNTNEQSEATEFDSLKESPI